MCHSCWLWSIVQCSDAWHKLFSSNVQFNWSDVLRPRYTALQFTSDGKKQTKQDGKKSVNNDRHWRCSELKEVLQRVQSWRLQRLVGGNPDRWSHLFLNHHLHLFVDVVSRLTTHYSCNAQTHRVHNKGSSCTFSCTDPRKFKPCEWNVHVT